MLPNPFKALLIGMRRSQILMIAGVLVALSLGLALAYPLLANQMPTLETPELGLTVAYTYISSPLNNSGLTGVWRNSSNGWQVNNIIFSYLVVMNITNYSNVSVQVNTLQVMVGPSITVDQDSGMTSAHNLLVSEYRMKEFPLPFNDVWAPNESKLVYLSGMNGVPDAFYSVVNSGSVWILGRAEGKIAYQNSGGDSAYDLKQVPLQVTDGNYLYNSLLTDNQMLRLYGLEAEVVPRYLD
ncbi:MAG: hypothetical protein ACQCN3_10000 [Candidatus Bathyarchaeia archaeon]|jgi:hypothetical protein